MAILTFLKQRKIIGIVAVVVILVLIFQGSIRAKVTPAPVYKTAQPKIETIEQTISASGKVKSDEEAVLKFQTSGYLNWVGVKKGDTVKKWQTIATLDQDQLQKELKQELLDYMNGRWDFDQTQDDYHTGNQPPEKVAVNNDIRRILEKAQFDLNRIVLDVEIKNLAIKYATLWTPIDGIVTAVDVPNAGVNITAAGATFTISNPDKVIFSAKVDEADIGSIKPGQKAKITLDAYPDKPINATVDMIDFTSTTTSSGGTAYEVKFSLPENTDQQYKIGMNGDVSIISSSTADALVVPIDSLREKDGQQYLWVLENGKPIKKNVKVGVSDDTASQILSGIDNNTTIITSDFTNLEKIYGK